MLYACRRTLNRTGGSEGKYRVPHPPRPLIGNSSFPSSSLSPGTARGHFHTSCRPRYGHCSLMPVAQGGGSVFRMFHSLVIKCTLTLQTGRCGPHHSKVWPTSCHNALYLFLNLGGCWEFVMKLPLVITQMQMFMLPHDDVDMQPYAAMQAIWKLIECEGIGWREGCLAAP